MDFDAARRNMVESQIRTNRVTDPLVISAMEEIPREIFADEAHAGIAYVDEALPLGDGRYVMEPMAYAQLLQEAAIANDDVVLDIGCATGYSSAILSRIAGTVVGLEEIPGFAAAANANLAELKIDNVAVMEGPLSAGWPAQAPYNAIIFSGAVASVPQTILDQLADGGRLMCIIAGKNGIGRGTLFTKFGDSVSMRAVFDAGSPILPGFTPTPEFQF
ncbi:MAG: protein-L-isoaspartate O-methyltransferase [Rhodospirillales bacterium]|nr:protein-L-isoaspartate O-methyltransferase [Rhodospirillales bacterium]